MYWEFQDDRPIYAQIIEQMKRFIISGSFHPGEKLPSVRDLAAEAGVNPNTMQRALAELEQTGLVYTQRTSGRFISDDPDLIQSLKTELARELLSRFLADMHTIGFTDAEISALLQTYQGGIVL